MMPLGLPQLGFETEPFEQPALQTGPVGFERPIFNFGGREVLMKDAVEWHYGKCRIKCVWRLTHAKGTKSHRILI